MQDLLLACVCGGGGGIATVPGAQPAWGGVLCEMKVHGERWVRETGLLSTPDTYSHQGGLAVSLAHQARTRVAFSSLKQFRGSLDVN